MTHPLTDEMCEQIKLHIFSQSDEDCMRTAYDLGESKGRADMLEQVTNWLKATKSTVKLCPSVLADQIEVAMRPQVVDLPQANSDVCGEEGIERARQRTLEENDELMRLLADS